MDKYELTNKEEDYILEEDRERNFEDMPDKDETVWGYPTQEDIVGVNHKCELGQI